MIVETVNGSEYEFRELADGAQQVRRFSRLGSRPGSWEWKTLISVPKVTVGEGMRLVYVGASGLVVEVQSTEVSRVLW